MAKKKKEEPKTDFLAVIDVGGAGSYFRHEKRNMAIAKVIGVFRRDFKQFYKVSQGDELVINVLDVTGYKTIGWDHQGFYIGDGEKRKPFDRPVEKYKHIIA